MTTIAHVSQAMQTTLTTAAEAADVALQYTKRPDRAKFTASTLVQTLVFGWLAHPDASVEQLAQSAARVGVEVSPQAIDPRFTLATAQLLREVLLTSVQQLIAADPVDIPILERFTEVRVHDSTTIVLPDSLADRWEGCGGSTATALKCGLQIDLLHGAWTGFDLADGRSSDQRLPLHHAAWPKGALRLADLGFFNLGVLADGDAAGAYWLSKLDALTVISDATHHEVSLLRFIAALDHSAAWDEWVRLGKGRRVRARLLVQPVPQEVADQRRRRIRKEARKKGHTPSAVVLALAAWTILITNAPPELLSLVEALVVAKVRWQIELIFKLWKSHGLVDQWRSGKPARIMCEVYGKLLAMLIQQWVCIVGCWAYPDRSLVKAAQVVRDHAPDLASARACIAQLTEVLQAVQRVLKRTARINPRNKHPNTYQLLLALTTEAKEA